MALLAAGSALVAGSHSEKEMQPQMQRVRVLRGFYFDKKLMKVDSEPELPRLFAIEVCAANKAVPIEARSMEAPASKDKGSKLV